jgi:hypothetical protein
MKLRVLVQLQPHLGRHYILCDMYVHFEPSLKIF